MYIFDPIRHVLTAAHCLAPDYIMDHVIVGVSFRNSLHTREVVNCILYNR